MDFVLVDNYRPGRTVYENSEDQLFANLKLPQDVALKRVSQELRNGVDLESCYCGVTFLGAASYLGRLDIVQLVIDFLKEEKLTELSRCHLDNVSRSPRQKKSMLDIYDTMGNTPLILAISGGHLNVCQLLLENGADINRPHQCSKQTPLLIAIEQNQDTIASYLIEIGADVQMTDNVGITPIYAAIKGKKESIIRELIAEDCDVDIGSQDHSPIFLATRLGQLSIVKVLVESGCHKDVSNKYGVTPVYEAAMKGHEEVLRYLLDQGCNPNLVDMYNQSPLHVAVLSGHLHCVKLLIQGGVNLKLRNHLGDNAVEVAMTMGKADILEYFLANDLGHLPNADSVRMCRQLSTVIDQGYTDVLQLLIRHCPRLPLPSLTQANTLFRTNEDLLKLLTRSRVQPLPEKLTRQMRDCDWLKSFHLNPRSLKDLCRANIRQTLGNKVLSDVHKLPLPVEIKEYLSLAYL